MRLSGCLAIQYQEYHCPISLEIPLRNVNLRSRCYGTFLSSLRKRVYFWNVFLSSSLACTFVIFQKKIPVQANAIRAFFSQSIPGDSNSWLLLFFLLFLFQSTPPLTCRIVKKMCHGVHYNLHYSAKVIMSVLDIPCSPISGTMFFFPLHKVYLFVVAAVVLMRLYSLATVISANIFQMITKHYNMKKNNKNIKKNATVKKWYMDRECFLLVSWVFVVLFCMFCLFACLFCSRITW